MDENNIHDIFINYKSISKETKKKIYKLVIYILFLIQETIS